MSKPRKDVVATCEIQFFVTDAGNSPVAKYIDGLPLRDKEAIMFVLEQYAARKATATVDSRPIRPPLYEFKIKQHRLLYAEFDGIIVVLHAFGKQSRKTPGKQIETATGRLKVEQARRWMH